MSLPNTRRRDIAVIRNACDIALRNGSINKEFHGMLVEILGNVNMAEEISQDQNIRFPKEQPISNPNKFALTTGYGFRRPAWNQKPLEQKGGIWGQTKPVTKTTVPMKPTTSNPPNQPSVGFSGEGRKIGQFYQGMTFSKKHQRMVPVSPKNPISEKNLDTEGQ